MARITPSDWRALEVTGAAAREIETLASFEKGLPDTLQVLHGVHWSRVQSGFAVIGEIDFVVIGPGGGILLIEQKSGLLDETPDGLVKRYGADKAKHVGHQIDRMMDGIRNRLGPIMRDEPLRLDYLLYCPDYVVKSRATAGLPDERIVDLPRRESLSQRIVQALAADEPRPLLARRLYEFFAGELDLIADAATLVGRSEALVTRLAGGLAVWARRLKFSPFRLRVTATAGSGKTQLALAVMQDAARAGRRAQYLCYNRPLADHIGRVLGNPAHAATFHQYCEMRLRETGYVPDFTRAGTFDEMVARFLALPHGGGTLDELVIDEGQDFEAQWLSALQRWVHPEGRIWWLEDPMQQLYERQAPDFADWVSINDDSNYRTPRLILDAVNRLLAPERTITAAAPYEGEAIEFLDYDSPETLIAQTRQALTQALLAKFRRQDIAVVTFSGRERSRLLPFDQIGPHKLRVFTGNYDLLGEPQYTDGDVLMETVYRFKGQSAPCVVLTEVDFEMLDERARRKLFVGMTRASMKLYVVLSRRAAGRLLAQ